MAVSLTWPPPPRPCRRASLDIGGGNATGDPGQPAGRRGERLMRLDLPEQLAVNAGLPAQALWGANARAEFALGDTPKGRCCIDAPTRSKLRACTPFAREPTCSTASPDARRLRPPGRAKDYPKAERRHHAVTIHSCAVSSCAGSERIRWHVSCCKSGFCFHPTF